MSTISASPAVYMILAENPWNTRATARTHGARAKKKISVATKARARPDKSGAWREELWSANQPAMAEEGVSRFTQ